MAKRIARKVYSEEKRAEILATAEKENLTAEEVKKRFGVVPVTYYSWRKKGKPMRAARSKGPVFTLDGDSMTTQVRSAIQAKVRALVPGIITEEVETLFK